MDAGDLDRAAQVLDDALASLPPDASQDGVRAVLLGQQSRVLMRLARYPESVAAADAALALAEPLNEDQVVAEAFINKASSLDYTGRRHEAMALYEHALELVRRRGWIAMELRAANNYSINVFDEDAAKAIELIRDGIALGRRVGNRGLTAWLVGSLGYYGFFAGVAWDEALDELADVLASITEPWERQRELGAEVLLRTARGADPAPFVEELERLAAGMTDPQLVAGHHVNLGQSALAVGDGQGAFAAAMRANEILPEFTTVGGPIAVRGAILLDDVARLREAIAILDARPNSDPSMRAARLWAHAALDAMDGHPDEAAVGFRAARDILREIGHLFEVARVAVDEATVLGAAHPDVVAAIPEARATFERLGARAYLERLDRLVAEAASTPGRVTEPETVVAR
jgi:tetratricopeptide (TPR) repeat protein